MSQPSEPRWVRNTALALFTVGLVIRLVVSWQDVGYLIESHVTQIFLIDDTFISHNIARHLARGDGMTFDGIHPTNGFQPLYVFLVVPLYWLIPHDPLLPVHLALTGLSLANALCGLLLYRTARLFTTSVGALCGLALWSLSPDVVRLGINGLETSLATLLIAAALFYYLTRLRLPGRFDARRLATLGLLLGLAILARLDSALFAVAVGFDLLGWGARRAGWARAVRAAAVCAAVAGLVTAPWFAVSLVQSGSILPISGKAVRFAALDMFEHQPPRDFYFRNVLGSAATLMDNPALPGWRAFSGRDYQKPEWAALYVNAPLLILLLFLAVRWERRLKGTDLFSTANRSVPFSLSHLGFLGLYAVLTVSAYSFWILGKWFYPRYYYTLGYVTVLLVSIALGRLFNQLRDRPQSRVALAGVVAVLYVSAFGLHWRTLAAREAGCGYFNVTGWIEANVPKQVTVGAFQSGALGYFLEHRVVNLDGVVNRRALEALEREEIYDYIRSEGIGVVADWDWVIFVSLVRNSKRTPPDLQLLAEICGANILKVP